MKANTFEGYIAYYIFLNFSCALSFLVLFSIVMGWEECCLRACEV